MNDKIQIISLKRLPFNLVAEVVYDQDEFYTFTLGNISEKRAMALIPQLVTRERFGEDSRRRRS